MDHIAKTVADVLLLSKDSGGIGASLTKLRASGSPLKSSFGGASSGPAPFAKILDTAVRAVQRGGKKVGALCFYMENWHLDFPEFLDWKHNAGDDYVRMRTANTSVFLSDEFMERAVAGKDWYMFDPAETMDLNELYGKAFSKRYAEYVAMAEAGKLRTFKKVPAAEQYRQIEQAFLGINRTGERAALLEEVERLKSGIRTAALTLVKWAVAQGGNTGMAIVAGNLRNLIGEPDLKERP